jgi:plasmid maintenance system antidote protein VapI
MAAPAAKHGGAVPPPHGAARLTRADIAPILGTPSRVSEVLAGKKGLNMPMVQRLRARFNVPADLLLSLPKKAPARGAAKRAAA